jgi:hypothetical protein
MCESLTQLFLLLSFFPYASWSHSYLICTTYISGVPNRPETINSKSLKKWVLNLVPATIFFHHAVTGSSFSLHVISPAVRVESDRSEILHR